MKKLIFAMGIAALMSGCYIGKAAFQAVKGQRRAGYTG